MSRMTNSRKRLLAALSLVTSVVLAFAATQSPRPAQQSTASAPKPAASTAESARWSYPGITARSGLAVAAALDPAAAGADPLTVEPRVPRAYGTPCVVTLFDDYVFVRDRLALPFFYTPPAECPGPWAKVKLVLVLSGPRPPGEPSANIEMAFDDNFQGEYLDRRSGTLFVGAPQEHDMLPVWRLERDVTDYARLFRRAQAGFLFQNGDNQLYEFDDPLPLLATRGLLVFYPASAATRAQRVPDAVRALVQVTAEAAEFAGTLPRNIERAYLDVTARALGGKTRMWYSCVPQATGEAFPSLFTVMALGEQRGNYVRHQGCYGGSYREVEIRIDGQLAGLAPLFPWLPSNFNNFFRDTVDYPAPSVQALNLQPFRVDLTPFAARLNNGAEHTIQATITAGGETPGPAGQIYVTGQLLMYLDRGKTVVGGALTRNTLASQPSTPLVQDGLALSGETVSGQIVTTLQRKFLIQGYVDTSHGRIRSSVWQNSRFVNTQTFNVVGLIPPFGPGFGFYESDYLQKIRLSSTVDRVMRRMRGDILLSEDRDYFTYPLILDWHAAGRFESQDEFGGPVFDLVAAHVHQARGVRASHYRRGMARYGTSLVDVFDGNHGWQPGDNPYPGIDIDWWSRRAYKFTDSFGSCYSASLTTAGGELQTRTRAGSCPNGNQIHWYAHPDGSPDSLGWAPQPR